MEIKRLIATLREYWWIVVASTVLIAAIAMIYQLLQMPTYEAEISLVIIPRGSNLTDVNSALDSVSILDKRSIAQTFGEAVRSQTAVRGASEKLGYDLAPLIESSAVSVAVDVVPDTNVIRIRTQSNNPGQAAEVANELGVSAIELVDRLAYPYSLQVLDVATLPNEPVNGSVVTIAVLGVVGGLLLGVAIALAASYLRQPVFSTPGLSVYDPVTGVLTSEYLLNRLRQEIARAERRVSPLSFGLLSVEPQESLDTQAPDVVDRVMRQVGAFLQDNVREGDLIGWMEDNTFAIAMPETFSEEAGAAIKDLIDKIRQRTFGFRNEGVEVHFIPNASIVEDHGKYRDGVSLISQAQENLAKAHAKGPNQMVLVRSHYERPFIEMEV